MERYTIYKGLQRPIVFKMLKGKYIYWGIGSLLAGIVIGGIVAATISSIIGIITAAGVAIPLFIYTLNKQKTGLHDKQVKKGIYMIAPENTLTYFRVKKHL